MLIGGFQSVDLEKMFVSSEDIDFRLPCDLKGEYNNQILTNNGRTATIYLLKECAKLSSDDVILMPDYLCWSVLLSVKESNVKYDFYHINKDLTINFESLKSKLKSNKKVKCIYIIQYFGVPYEKDAVDELLKIKECKDIILIEDITQTLLTKGDGRIGIGDYLVASTRKWFPVTDGGLLAAKKGRSFEKHKLLDPYNEAAYKQLLISLVRDYFNKNSEKDIHEYLLMEKKANESRYTDLSVREITGYSRNVMLSTSIEEISNKRVINYNYLYSRLTKISELKILSKCLDNGFVPFGLVLLVEDRDKFYEFLASKRIIGEIQWILPYEYYKPGKDAKYLSNHNIMIQCDQRYTINDMNYVADTIESYFKDTV